MLDLNCTEKIIQHSANTFQLPRNSSRDTKTWASIHNAKWTKHPSEWEWRPAETLKPNTGCRSWAGLHLHLPLKSLT